MLYIHGNKYFKRCLRRKICNRRMPEYIPREHLIQKCLSQNTFHDRYKTVYPYKFCTETKFQVRSTIYKIFAQLKNHYGKEPVFCYLITISHPCATNGCTSLLRNSNVQRFCYWFDAYFFSKASIIYTTSHKTVWKTYLLRSWRQTFCNKTDIRILC